MPFIKKPMKVPWANSRPAQGRRKRSNQKFYNSSRWRRCSKEYEAMQPFCEDCADLGISTDATGRNGATDHVYSVNQALSDYESGKIDYNKLMYFLYDHENHRRLCTRHHAIKSGKEAHK